MEWDNSHSLIPKGQALVIHGLNFDPTKMNAITSLLKEQGLNVLKLTLLGHKDDLSEMKTASYEKWEAQVKEAFAELESRNQIEGGMKTVVAASLGGLLAINHLGLHPEQKIDQAIFFAPAISVRARSKFVMALSFLGNSFMIPSASPKEYRAQRGTSIAAYRALFKALDSFESIDLKTLNFPVTIFLDKKDELVSFKGISGVCSGMPHCELIEVSNKESNLKKSYHHLITDSDAVGVRTWNEKIVPVIQKACN